MSFGSISFLCIFLPVSVLLYQVVPSERGKKAFLILTGLMFYAAGALTFLPLLLLLCLLNWAAALLIERSPIPSRLVLILSVIVNFGCLGYYKYTGMLLSTVNRLSGTAFSAGEIALPLGISFFTFQLMSYTADVYTGRTRAEKNFFKVLLYTCFFPKLVMGPIVSFDDFYKGARFERVSAFEISEGLRRFLFGLSKKILISDTLAVTADYVYGLSGAELSMPAAWLGALAYMFQIYFDFSGYSDMAIGLGRMLGFSLPENFRTPYASSGIREFWRRWHMTLNIWFRNYLYIPLGGNRKGRTRSMINQLVVFFFTGLWHGASWTFVLWGLFHGAFCLLETRFPNFTKKLGPLRHLYVWLVVLTGFVLFRADTLSQAMLFYQKMFTGFPMTTLQQASLMQIGTSQFVLVLALAVVISLPWRSALYPLLQERRPAVMEKVLPAAAGAASIVLLLLCLMAMAGGSYTAFIYTRF